MISCQQGRHAATASCTFRETRIPIKDTIVRCHCWHSQSRNSYVHSKNQMNLTLGLFDYTWSAQ